MGPQRRPLGHNPSMQLLCLRPHWEGMPNIVLADISEATQWKTLGGHRQIISSYSPDVSVTQQRWEETPLIKPTQWLLTSARRLSRSPRGGRRRGRPGGRAVGRAWSPPRHRRRCPGAGGRAPIAPRCRQRRSSPALARSGARTGRAQSRGGTAAGPPCARSQCLHAREICRFSIK